MATLTMEAVDGAIHWNGTDLERIKKKKKEFITMLRGYID